MSTESRLPHVLYGHYNSWSGSSNCVSLSSVIFHDPQFYAHSLLNVMILLANNRLWLYFIPSSFDQYFILLIYQPKYVMTEQHDLFHHVLHKQSNPWLLIVETLLHCFPVSNMNWTGHFFFYSTVCRYAHNWLAKELLHTNYFMPVIVGDKTRFMLTDIKECLPATRARHVDVPNFLVDVNFHVRNLFLHWYLHESVGCSIIN